MSPIEEPGSPYDTPVVIIMNENGPVRINATDFDPAKHTLAPSSQPISAAIPVQAPKPKIPAAPSTGYFVAQISPGRWYLTDAAGTPYPGIPFFPTKAAADAAAMTAGL